MKYQFKETTPKDELKAKVEEGFLTPEEVRELVRMANEILRTGKDCSEDGDIQ